MQSFGGWFNLALDKCFNSDEVFASVRSRIITVHHLSYFRLGKEVSVYCSSLSNIHFVNKHLGTLRGKWG